MQTTQQVENKLVTTFDQMSQELQRDYLIQWTQEIYSWMNRARAYVASCEGLSDQLASESSKTIKDVEDILKKRRVAKNLILNNVILKDGYVLLNKIGETIRGEEIKYSITVSKTGEALSTGSTGTGGVYTWTIPLSKFLTLLNFTTKRMVLKSPTTIYKMLETQIEKNEQNLTYEKWSDEKLQSYAIFLNQARGASHGHWSKVNEGNILEAFLRFLDGGNIPSYNDNQEYWHNIGSTMKQTMAKPDPFFLGGDLYNVQIKGLNASVTNINTLIFNLGEVLKILGTSQSGSDILRKYIKTNYISQLENSIEQDQLKVVDNLINFFTSKVDRINISI